MRAFAMDSFFRTINSLFSRTPATGTAESSSTRSGNINRSQPVTKSDNRLWGFGDLDPQENLTCIICHDVFKNPVRVLSRDSATEFCIHVFCDDCITQYVNKHAFQCCPICRTPWKSPIIFQPDNDTILKLSHVTVLCKLCGDNVLYHRRAAHRFQCPDNMVTNPRLTRCDQCNRSFPTLFDMRLHEPDCPRTELVSCVICGLRVLRRDLFDHQRNCEDDKFHKSSSSPGPSSTVGSNHLFRTIVLLVLSVAAIGMLGFLGAMR